MGDLPELNEGRFEHGCGYFYNNDMQRVFLVVGGLGPLDKGPSSSCLSSTETLVEGGQSWNFQQPLPSSRYFLHGISLPNTVIMTGGEDGDGQIEVDDVLTYVPETSDWKHEESKIPSWSFPGQIGRCD